MREILFRGKSISSNDWIYGSLLVSNSGLLQDSKEYMICTPNLEKYHVLPESIGQFTGLIDKNGQKIFEGDILSFSKSYAPYFAKVIFATDEIGSCGCCFSAFQGSGFVGEVLPGSEYSYSCFSEDLRASEIIGNVFDNPDLVNHHE